MAAVPSQAFMDYLVPGKRVWIKVLDPTKKTKIVVYGTKRNYTYVGYNSIHSKTFLVFDVVEGAGKKTQMTSFSVNADHVLYCGVFDDRD